jgi:hypothetical protein
MPGDLVKNKLLAILLLAAALLTVGCSTSSSSGGSSGASATSAGASTSGGGSGPASASATAGAVTPCTSADLQASIGGGPGPGMSQDHTGIQLVNTGSSPCTLHGYPGVSWVAGSDGHQVGAAAVRQPDPTGGPETTITLAPGALASAPLDIVDASVITPSQCKPVPVTGLRVYPPGDTTSLFIQLGSIDGGYGECSLTTQQPTLTVGYMQSGAQAGGGGTA